MCFLAVSLNPYMMYGVCICVSVNVTALCMCYLAHSGRRHYWSAGSGLGQHMCGWSALLEAWRGPAEFARISPTGLQVQNLEAYQVRCGSLAC